MTSSPRGSTDPSALAAAISEVMAASSRTVAVAESLTCGQLATELGASEGASEWFSGGVIAYSNQVKYKVLNVDPGPVITAPCGQQMARGVAALTGSDLAVATTGVGGPGPVEDKPAGTVFIAVHGAGIDRVEEHHFPGDCEDVLPATTRRALAMLLAVAQDQAGHS